MATDNEYDPITNPIREPRHSFVQSDSRSRWEADQQAVREYNARWAEINKRWSERLEQKPKEI